MEERRDEGVYYHAQVFNFDLWARLGLTNGWTHNWPGLITYFNSPSSRKWSSFYDTTASAIATSIRREGVRRDMNEPEGDGRLAGSKLTDGYWIQMVRGVNTYIQAVVESKLFVPFFGACVFYIVRGQRRICWRERGLEMLALQMLL